MGNTHNPLFDYNWEMVARDFNIQLQTSHTVANDTTSGNKSNANSTPTSTTSPQENSDSIV